MMKRIKLILKSVREYKIFALITPLFMMGEAIMECSIPWAMDKMVTSLTNSSELNSEGWFWIILLIGMAIVSIVCGIMGGIFAAKASTGLAKNLREDMYKKLNSFSFANIDKFSSASLVTRMTTDVANTQQSFQMCIRIIVRLPMMLIFSTLMAFLTGGKMAFIFIGLIPIIGIGLAFIAKKAMPIFKRVFPRYDAMNESVQENIEGVRVVKSFVREDYEQEKFNKTSNSLTDEFIKAEKILAFNNPLINTAIHLSNILVVMIGSYLILKGCNWDPITKHATYANLTPSGMSALITYGIQILTSIMFLSMILVFLVMSLEAISRIGEILEEEPTIKNPGNPIYDVKDGSVEFKNVNFKYFETADRYSLENINLNIKSGDFVGVLGSTGSGKTSLVNLISRLYDVTDGEILVGGNNVKEYDLKTLRDNVAVVLQKNVLFSGTIEDNLRWGNLNATKEEIEAACDIAQASEFINQMPNGYQTYIEQGGTNVSGGQKQRLCIARAILKNPKILILDDSTSAVDTKTDKLIRSGLKDIIPNTTKIVIAQRISSIEDADQIVIMEDGKINAIGTHEELLKNNHIYQDVYYSQNKTNSNSNQEKKGDNE